MCGRYNFSVEHPDEKMTALIDVMERKYPVNIKPARSSPAIQLHP